MQEPLFFLGVRSFSVSFASSVKFMSSAKFVSSEKPTDSGITAQGLAIQLVVRW